MAYGNSYRLYGSISASDGTIQTQNNLNATVGNPAMAQNFFISDNAVPAVVTGVVQSPKLGTPSHLAAVGVVTDWYNNNRLLIDDGKTATTINPADVIKAYNSTVGGTTLLTVATGRIFNVVAIEIYNAAGDAYVDLATAGGATLFIAAVNNAAALTAVFSYGAAPIPLFPGEKMRSAGTGAVNVSYYGFYSK